MGINLNKLFDLIPTPPPSPARLRVQRADELLQLAAAETDSGKKQELISIAQVEATLSVAEATLDVAEQTRGARYD